MPQNLEENLYRLLSEDLAAAKRALQRYERGTKPSRVVGYAILCAVFALALIWAADGGSKVLGLSYCLRECRICYWGCYWHGESKFQKCEDVLTQMEDVLQGDLDDLQKQALLEARSRFQKGISRANYTLEFSDELTELLKGTLVLLIRFLRAEQTHHGTDVADVVKRSTFASCGFSKPLQIRLLIQF